MTRQRVRLCLPLVLVLALAASAAACKRPSAVAGGLDAGAASPGVSAYDVETTDLSRVLGGMPPARSQAFPALLGLPAWREYDAEARDRWSAAWSARLQPLRSWADTALKDASGGCRTLLHPFGGTDFLAAYLMFPACEGYVLVGSEPAGQLPTFDAATAAQVAAVADDVRSAFPEVFAKGAGARRRRAAPRRLGALTLLLVQLARLDARIVNASRFDIAEDGRPLESIPIRGGNNRPAALSITFEVPNGRPQSLVYLPADVDDAALRRRPGVWTFLRLQAPFTTLIAPASRLQGDRATLLRQLVFAQSRFILADRGDLLSRSLGPRDWSVSTLEQPPASVFGRDATPTLASRRTPAAGPTPR
jgi:hypothetical protein